MTVNRLHKLIYVFLILGAVSLIADGFYVSYDKRHSARQMYSGFLKQIAMTMKGWINESYMPPENNRARTIVEGVIQQAKQNQESLPISFDPYLVDASRNAASTPRFYKEEEQKRGIIVDAVADKYHFNSTPINFALAGGTGEMVAPDYRGKPVISAVAPVQLGNSKGAISIDMDEEEALGVADKPSHYIGRFITFLCLGLAGFCYRKTTKIQPDSGNNDAWYKEAFRLAKLVEAKMRVDKSGVIRDCNIRAAEILDVSFRSDVVGNTVDAIYLNQHSKKPNVAEHKEMRESGKPLPDARKVFIQTLKKNQKEVYLTIAPVGDEYLTVLTEVKDA